MKNNHAVYDWEMLFVGIVLGTVLSFFILIPKAVTYQKSIICRNGELVQKEVQESYTTFERINGTECEPNDRK